MTESEWMKEKGVWSIRIKFDHRMPKKHRVRWLAWLGVCIPRISCFSGPRGE